MGWGRSAGDGGTTGSDIAEPPAGPENTAAPAPELPRPATFGGVLEIPPEVEAIVLKAMAVKREDRYPTVEDLRRDILNFLEGLPVAALREGALRRAGKWLRRHPRVFAAILTSAALLLVGGSAAFVVLRSQEQERYGLLEQKFAAESLAAEEARKRAEVLEERRKLDEARSKAYDLYLRAIDAQREYRKNVDPVALLDEAVRIDPDFTEGWVSLSVARLNQAQWEPALAALETAAGQYRDRKLPELQARCLYYAGEILRIYRADYQRALPYYQRVAEVAPESVWGRLGQGYALALLGRFAEALPFAEAAVQVDPEFWEVHQLRCYLYGQAYSDPLRGIRNTLLDLPKALADADRAIELNDRSGNLRVNRALLRQQLGKLAEAEEDLRRAVELEPFNANAFNLLGALRRQQSRFEEAVRAYDRALQLDPRKPEVFFNRAYAHLMLGNPDQALEDYDSFLLLVPGNGQGLARRAGARLRTGDVPGARRDLDEALRVGQESESTFVAIVRLAADEGRPEVGVEYCTRALSRYPQSVEIWRARARCLLLEGDDAAGGGDLEQAARLGGETAEAWSQAGATAYGTGRWAVAARCYDRALAVDGNHVDALFYRAGCSFHLGASESAVRDFTRLLELRPDDLDALIFRGSAFRAAKHWDQAEADLDRAVKLAPGTEAQFQRGLLREERGQVDGALADFERCVATEPQSAKALHHRGLARMKVGEDRAAEADLRRAATLRHSDSFGELAGLYRRQGRIDEARQLLESWAKVYPALRETIDARLRELAEPK